jgi:hypothetical protein
MRGCGRFAHENQLTRFDSRDTGFDPNACMQKAPELHIFVIRRVARMLTCNQYSHLYRRAGQGVRRHCGNLQSDMLGSGAVPVWLTEKAPKNDRKGGAGTRFRTFPTSVPTPDQVPVLVFGFRGARSKNPDSLRPCGAVTPIALGRTVRPTVLTSSYRSIKKKPSEKRHLSLFHILFLSPSQTRLR